MSDNLTDALSDLDNLDMDDLLPGSETTGALTATGGGLDFFQDVPLTVTLEVASREVSLGELSQVQEGDVLPLNKLAGEPLDVMVNGLFFARAEVVMVDGRYAIKFISRDPKPASGQQTNG